MYQLLARRLGFSVHRARALESLGHVHGRPVEDEASGELFFIGALGHADPLEEFSGYFHDENVRLRYLIAEHVTLMQVAPGLPARYRHRLEVVTAELGRRGLAGTAITDAARAYLVDAAGLPPSAAEAVLGR